MKLILDKQLVTVNGKTIPKIFGGFSEGQPAILAKQIAEIHDCEVKQINRIVSNNNKWFDEWIDFIDLRLMIPPGSPGVLSKHPSNDSQNQRLPLDEIADFLIISGFYPSTQAIGGAQHIYLFSQQGYAMLCKLLKSDLAKQIYKEMVRTYFRLAEIQSRPSFEILCKEQKAILEIAQSYGLQGNQASLFANRLIHERYGINLLEQSGQLFLTSETQEPEYNATTLGKDLLGGISAQKVNKLLERAGLIRSYRDNKNRLKWDLTEEGKPYGVWKDTTKKHHSGTPVQQLFYKKSIVDILKAKNLIGSLF